MDGKFIVFEGADGTGKTTQARMLYDALYQAAPHQTGRMPILTHEPTAWLKDKILDEESDAITQLFLFLADRAHHVSLMRGWLKDGHIVICDRFNDSTVVYQSLLCDIDMRELRYWCNKATGHLQPDLTIVLEVDEAEQRRRIEERGHLDRFDALPPAFHLKVRERFRELCRFEDMRWLVSLSGDPQQVHAEIAARVKQLGMWRS